jgi:hypothetical protein
MYSERLSILCASDEECGKDLLPRSVATSPDCSRQGTLLRTISKSVLSETHLMNGLTYLQLRRWLPIEHLPPELARFCAQCAAHGVAYLGSEPHQPTIRCPDLPAIADLAGTVVVLLRRAFSVVRSAPCAHFCLTFFRQLCENSLVFRYLERESQDENVVFLQLGSLDDVGLHAVSM